MVSSTNSGATLYISFEMWAKYTGNYHFSHETSMWFFFGQKIQARASSLADNSVTSSGLDVGLFSSGLISSFSVIKDIGILLLINKQ